jgi:DNA-binding transcriptional ArsR family regulator
MGTPAGTLTEIRELKAEIAGLRTDLQKFVERANQQHVEAVLGGIRKEYAGACADQQISSAKADLSARMVEDCPMKTTCYGVFTEFLGNSARHITEGTVSEDLIQSYREKMAALRKKGKKEGCATCFTELGRLFENQVGLMQTLGIYRNEKGISTDFTSLPDDAVVKDLLEPVASPPRFQIIRTLATGTRTFSDISQLTGLRGGNLLFHIRKLTDAGMILQRHERGDYIITDKGFRTLTAIAQLYQMVYPQKTGMGPEGN